MSLPPEVQARIALWQSRLQGRGLTHRAAPPVPTTCCGRGCQGCVWEGYQAALAWWEEEAQALLAGAGRPDPTGLTEI